MTRGKAATLIAVALMASLTALAKGNFQAEGVLSGVRKQDNGVEFRFKGKLTLSYATAGRDDPGRERKVITLDPADVPVRIGNWTRPHHPAEADPHPDVESTYATLSRYATTAQPVRMSIDNPGLAFSNAGELMSISGTYVYVRGSDR